MSDMPFTYPVVNPNNPSFPSSIYPSSITSPTTIQSSIIEPVINNVARSQPMITNQAPEHITVHSSEEPAHLNDLYYHQLTRGVSEVENANKLKDSVTKNVNVIPEVEHIVISSATLYSMYFFSLLSCIEVGKSVLMAFRLIYVEFPIVENVVFAGQLNEELFIRFSIKAGLLIFALIFSIYAGCIPWIKPFVNKNI